MIHNLIKLYKENQVIEDPHYCKDLPLHKACPSSELCWQGREKDDKELDKYNGIHLPFIGPYYCNSPFRLAALGQNYHGYGGLLSAHHLFIDLINRLQKGYKTMHKGSTLFHRLAVYATLMIRSDWRIEGEDVFMGESRLVDSFEALADSLNHIVFLNAIKCSPHWERSEPTHPMFDNCPKKFLVKELEILSPKILLVLGKRTLDTIPKQNCKTVEKAEDSQSEIHQTELTNGPVVVFKVVHPAARNGGNAESIILNAAKLLRTPNVMEILQIGRRNTCF